LGKGAFNYIDLHKLSSFILPMAINFWHWLFISGGHSGHIHCLRQVNYLFCVLTWHWFSFGF